MDVTIDTILSTLPQEKVEALLRWIRTEQPEIKGFRLCENGTLPLESLDRCSHAAGVIWDHYCEKYPNALPAKTPETPRAADRYNVIVQAMLGAGYGEKQAKMVAAALKKLPDVPTDGEALAQLWSKYTGKTLNKPAGSRPDLPATPPAPVERIRPNIRQGEIAELAHALLLSDPMKSYTAKQISDTLGSPTTQTYWALQNLVTQEKAAVEQKPHGATMMTLYRWSPGPKARGKAQERLAQTMRAILCARPGITSADLFSACRDLLGQVDRTTFYAVLQRWIGEGIVIQEDAPGKIKNAKLLRFCQ